MLSALMTLIFLGLLWGVYISNKKAIDDITEKIEKELRK